MKLTTLTTYLLCTVGGVAAAVVNSSDPQAAASLQILQWQKQYDQYIEATVKTRKTGCTSENIVYRQEWGALSKQARREYIEAVRCLQKKPATSPRSSIPGTRTRFDDFSGTHIIQGPFVHNSGLFFYFHRYFVWLYEKALREECGYNGTQPYWDWTISWQDPRNSTVLDGSPYSMGSNGRSIPHGPLNLTAFGHSRLIPPGTGGGCVYSGPFQNYSVNLGPSSFEPLDGDGGLDYNPRCLMRDIAPSWSKNFTKPTDVTRLISGGTDLASFDSIMEGAGGVHAAGHFTIGGICSDPLASAGDPAFYLHHAGVDRVWTIWQNLNPHNRTRQVYGTGTAFNHPPSPNVTLDTEIDFMALAPKQSVSNLASSIDGPFCYEYI